MAVRPELTPLPTVPLCLGVCVCVHLHLFCVPSYRRREMPCLIPQTHSPTTCDLILPFIPFLLVPLPPDYQRYPHFRSLYLLL